MKPEILMEKLNESEGVMFRQINPKFDNGNSLDPQAFRPTEADEGFLSVDRSSLTSAKDSFELHLMKGKQSSRVMGVSVEEFETASLHVYADPLQGTDDTPENIAHALVDCTDLPPGKGKQARRRRMSVYLQLVSFAEDRGTLYQAQYLEAS